MSLRLVKFSEEILKQLGLESVEKKEPVNVMRVSEMSRFMKPCAERIANKSRKYIECSDVETKMDCIVQKMTT